MRVVSTRLLALCLTLAAGCSRGPAPTPVPPEVPSGPPEGARSREQVAAVQRDGGSRLPPAPARVEDGGEDGGSPRAVRAEIRPLTRFQLVPVGQAAVGPARAALESLRARYVAYGFDLGALQTGSMAPDDCAELLRRRVGARGTLYVVADAVRCSTPFGAVNTQLATGLVSLAPLGPPGPLSERRLTALVGSVVGELLGLSTPCADGRTCCALRKAPDVKTFDAQARVSCPAHAGELDRIREAAGMQ